MLSMGAGVYSSYLAAHMPLPHSSSHLEEAALDANSSTASTLALLHTISFAWAARNYSSNHLP